MKHSKVDINNVDLKNGLSSSQVKKQIEQQNVNEKPTTLTKSVKQIVRENTFTLFNLINVVLGAFVFYTGSYKNLLFLLIAVANTIIGNFQEIRSKRQIDKMALLSRSKLPVIRDGKERMIYPEEIVLGDVIRLGRGDQIPADGKIIDTNMLEVDESQITGESDSISKKTGEEVISGSSIVGGGAKMIATQVGSSTFVHHLSNNSNVNNDHNGKLLATINKIIKILTIVIVPLGTVLFISKLFHGSGINSAILGTVAAMIGMIPEGLVLLSSVTLAVSAMKLSRKNVLVRNLSSIENMARVDTIALDKTGTITSGKLQFNQLIPWSGYSKEEINRIIGATIHSIDDNDETAEALKKAFSDPKWNAQKIIPFSSARKWSGASFEGSNYAIGAPQFILDNESKELNETIQKYAKEGSRVLCIVRADKMDDKSLSGVKIMGLILIDDVIRSNAESSLRYFLQQGIQLNVISGDDPTTVASIAKKVKVPDADKQVDMSKVPDETDYQKLVKEHRIFGRVTPDQKKRLIKAMQLNERTVAMTGDGVNDLLALQQADCGIAMASGSESTKSIANFILLNSNFDSMINVLLEGRRVTNNISSEASLYLIKTMYSTVLSFVFIFLTRDYPFQPIQLTPITTFMIGLPSFLLAFEPNYHRLTDQFTKYIVKGSIPAAISIIGYVLGIGTFERLFGMSFAEVSTLNVLVTGIICWSILWMISKPLNYLKTGILIFTSLFFAGTFLIWNRVFSLMNLLNGNLLLIAIPLCISIYPVLKFVRYIVIKLYNRYYLKKKNPK